MPRPTLTPCPFCGNPKPLLRQWWTGPCSYREERDPKTRRLRTVRDYGRMRGWKVWCPCSAQVARPYVPGRATKQACRQAAIDGWNQRSDTEYPACPFCGFAEPGLEDVEPEGYAGRTLPRVFCPCGVSILGQVTNDPELWPGDYSYRAVSGAYVWSLRTAPEGYVSDREEHQRRWRRFLEESAKELHRREVWERRRAMALGALTEPQKLVIHKWVQAMIDNPKRLGRPTGKKATLSMTFTIEPRAPGEEAVEFALENGPKKS